MGIRDRILGRNTDDATPAESSASDDSGERRIMYKGMSYYVTPEQYAELRVASEKKSTLEVTEMAYKFLLTRGYNPPLPTDFTSEEVIYHTARRLKEALKYIEDVHRRNKMELPGWVKESQEVLKNANRYMFRDNERMVHGNHPYSASNDVPQL